MKGSITASTCILCQRIVARSKRHLTKLKHNARTLLVYAWIGSATLAEMPARAHQGMRGSGPLNWTPPPLLWSPHTEVYSMKAGRIGHASYVEEAICMQEAE